MAKYTLNCDMDHEPMTFTVEADDDDSAMTMMMDQLKPHLGDMHPDMSDKTDEENMAYIKSKWTRED